MAFFHITVDIISQLIQNIVLLFALGFIYAASNYDSQTQKVYQKVFAGVVIGVFAILIMLNAWTLFDGLNFDTRSVLLVFLGFFLRHLQRSSLRPSRSSIVSIPVGLVSMLVLQPF